jgi:head-tail adaptor
MLLGIQNVDAEQAAATVQILLKYQSDITKALKEFQSEGGVLKKGEAAARG